MTASVDTADQPASPLLRYSVTPSDVAQVRQQIGQNAACEEQMVCQFIQATGGDLALVRLQCIHHWLC